MRKVDDRANDIKSVASGQHFPRRRKRPRFFIHSYSRFEPFDTRSIPAMRVIEEKFNFHTKPRAMRYLFDYLPHCAAFAA